MLFSYNYHWLIHGVCTSASQVSFIFIQFSRKRIGPTTSVSPPGFHCLGILDPLLIILQGRHQRCPENCMKMKKIWPGRGRPEFVCLDPPLDTDDNLEFKCCYFKNNAK